MTSWLRWVWGLAAVMVLASSCAYVGRASVNTAGVEADGASANPALSADGRYTVFESTATNLDGLTFGMRQIYRHDALLDETVMVSRQWGCPPLPPCILLPGNGDSRLPDISADGRYVVFESDATNLGTDTNGVTDIYRVDLVNESVARISTGLLGAEADGPSAAPSIAGDGLSVAYESDADNLAGASNTVTDVFLWSTTSIGPSHISAAAQGSSDGDSGQPALSDDGTTIAFRSWASNLVAGQPATNGPQLFRFQNGLVTLLSAGLILPIAVPDVLDIDGDGDRFLIVVEPFFGTFLVDANMATFGAFAGVGPGAIAADGKRVVFSAAGPAWLEQTGLGLDPIEISTDFLGNHIATATDVAISADGRTAAFRSSDADLVSADTNGVADIFIKSIPFVTVDSVLPGALPPGQATNVTIMGNGFDQVPTVLFGGDTTVSNIVIVDESTITATVTVAAGATPGARSPIVGIRNPGTGLPDTGAAGSCDSCVEISS